MGTTNPPFSNKKGIFVFVVVFVSIIGLILLLNRNTPRDLQSPVVKSQAENSAKIVPSETFIEYIDPSGFSFSYPDNLSITNNEITDNSTYTDIQLFAKGINGSLSFKITDTKFKTPDDWLKANQVSSKITPKEVNLGTLKAVEVQTSDRLMLGAIDQGILFTVEMPLIEQDFWMKVYEKIISGFTFNSVSSQNSSGVVSPLSPDVSFEGEEVVE